MRYIQYLSEELMALVCGSTLTDGILFIISPAVAPAIIKSSHIDYFSVYLLLNEVSFLEDRQFLPPSNSTTSSPLIK
jgi:hypothetical protein